MVISKARERTSRRRFLKWSQAALALAGASPFLPSNASAFGEGPKRSQPPGTDYYDKLGVTRLINAAGTYTIYTAATMPPQVQEAVAQAARHPVGLLELQRAAGTYIAKRLHCEAALVSCGADSALTLAAAACLQAANPDLKVGDIPEKVAGKRNEVIVQKAHRYGYDHAFHLCGIRFVEVVTLDDYKRAFTAKTMMTNFFNAAPGGEISHQDWLAVAHEHNVPCNIDAAADMPPISHLWKYTDMGFDTVCFSGGKGIRGPQNAGLLLGRRKLIELAAANNNPFDEGVGRGMKVAKEQIIGMVAALDWILEQNDEQLQREFSDRANYIGKMVKDVPSMKSEIFVPPVANHVPHLVLSYDPSVVGITPHEVQQRLRSQTPRIELNPSTGGEKSITGRGSGINQIVVGTWMLQPGEDEIVGRELRKVLMAPKSS